VDNTLKETLPPHRPLADPARPASAGPGEETRELSLGNPPTSTSPTRIGPYEIEVKIDEGGMGKVYRCFDTSLRRRVAIKVLHDKFGRDPRYRARFIREAQTVASLIHSHVAQVYGIDTSGDRLSIVMEYVENGSLEAKLASDGAIPVGDVARWIRQAAIGLQAAQSQGIVHRDIKPSNLLLDRHGNIKIVDFGLAKARGVGDGESETITDEGIVLGTPQYLSPEQGRGRSVDHRSDIYSLGVTFYHLVCGKPPFESNSHVGVIVAHVQETPFAPEELRPDVPVDFTTVIGRMMAVEADDRYLNYEELIEDLDALLAGHAPIHARRDRGRFATRGVATSTSPPRRRGRKLAAVAGVVIAVAAIGAGLALAKFRDESAETTQLLAPWLSTKERGAAALRFDFDALPSSMSDALWRAWIRSADTSTGTQGRSPSVENGALVWSSVPSDDSALTGAMDLDPDEELGPMTLSAALRRVDSIAVHVSAWRGPIDFAVIITDPKGASRRELSIAMRSGDELEQPVIARRSGDIVSMLPPTVARLPRAIAPWALFVNFQERGGRTRVDLQVRRDDADSGALYDAAFDVEGADWNSGAITLVCRSAIPKPARLALRRIVIVGELSDERIVEVPWPR
jgi:hypothetical protein